MLQKSLDYGLSGYQVPSVPRAPRSSRRRGSIRKKAQDNQMCAFDLLATVAGTLLLENEISPNSSVQKDQALNVKDVVMEEQHDEVIPLKPEHYDQGSMELPFLSLELGLQDHALKKEVSVPQNDASLTPASMITSSDCSGKDGPLNNIVLNDEKSKFSNQSTNPEQCCDGVKDSCLPDACERVEPVGSQGEMCLDNTKLSLGTDHYNCGSLSLLRGQNVKLVTRDDDENSSGCTHPDTLKPTNRLSHIRGRKIRKLWASKYHRVAPKMKNGDFSESEWRYIYCSRKTGFKRQRSQRIYPFKKRKIYHYSSLSKSDEKAIGTNASFGSLGHGVNGSSSSVSSQSTGFQSKESHVKFRIKSFRVPELFIEMPETATIGSLKRTVLEALTTLLEDGLHVGVLLQGKKIRDDNRTLLQSGICRNDKVESLGFTLEPTSMHRNPPLCSEDSSLVLSSDLPQPLSRSPEAITVHQGASHPSSLDHPVSNALHLIESDHDSAPSPAEISTEKGTVDSRAIVPLPEGSPQALSVLPANLKTKRSDMAQRRIRRPFSVTEVEALVQAVEKLGTGRWRDVKLCAFENVKHRTYVDLKDKWKTLVHTARISPQQRRGELVPQELLERVLAAHAYWSQQQAKQQLKQQSEACLLL